MPRFTRRAYSRMARPSAPLCVENATRPAGGNTGENVAFSSTLGSAFSSPMQLGPIMRMPASRTIVRSSASRARPSTPVSEKPALMTTSALTCFAIASWTTADTLAAGTAITARSMSPGTSVSRGYAGRPCSCGGLWMNRQNATRKPGGPQVVENLGADAAAVAAAPTIATDAGSKNGRKRRAGSQTRALGDLRRQRPPSAPATARLR